MNAAELPMILFTVLAQMSVGAFITLGVINILAPIKFDRETVERATDPAIYAIGPTLVLGLFASIFHMNDVFNVFNVFRNVGTSWLSREIIFGIAFAAFGFIFALMQWFKIGTRTLRKIIAGVAAVMGIALVWSMAMIYMSVAAVPAWNTWIIMFHFFATAILLGSLAVGTAMVLHLNRRIEASHSDDAEEELVASDGVVTGLRKKVREMSTAPVETAEFSLASLIVRTIAILAAITGSLILLSYIVYLTGLSGGNASAQASAETFSSPWFIVRLLMLIIAAIVMSLFAHKMASQPQNLDTRALTILMVSGLMVATIGELMGRAFHYGLLIKVGV